MNFFKRANSLNISILKPLILCPSPSAVAEAAVGALGADVAAVGTGGGAIFDVVGGATGEDVGSFGGIGGVETVGGATLGGTTVVGFADDETGGILGGVGIGDIDLVVGGEPIVGTLGGPAEGIPGTWGGAELLGGPEVAGARGTPGTGGAVAGIPGVLDVGGGGGGGVPLVGMTSSLNFSRDCSKLSARDLYS